MERGIDERMSTSSAEQASDRFWVHTGTSFNSVQKRFEENMSFQVDPHSGLIVDMFPRSDSEIHRFRPEQDLDLRSLVILPGLVDAHTHIFLHSYEETSAYDQIVNESFVERIVRATNHCRAALDAGYTTYRDLGTEGMKDADVGVRDSINRGLIPGPRLLVATEPLSSTGGYTIQHSNQLGGCTVPAISDTADGVDGVRAAVRRRLGAGADLIKVYIDEEKRNARFPEARWAGAASIQFPPDEGGKPRNYLLYTAAEMRAIVEEANEAHSIVAVHASTPTGVIRAAEAGATTIEHGQEPDYKALLAMKGANCIWVPTVAVFEAEMPPEPFQAHLNNVKKGWQLGIRLGAGGDIGPVSHGENARELELLVKAGIPVEDVLQAATLHAFLACGGTYRPAHNPVGRDFGYLDIDCAADFVGFEGDPREDISAVRRVRFVMKDGKVWKKP